MAKATVEGRRVLIIEDDPSMLRGLMDNFAGEGYVVTVAEDGERGLEAALNAPVDLVILDIMLPGVNGYEICRRMRQEKIDTPIIMLTAKSEESDVLLGLGLGADDYVTKPFSIRELLARAEVVLRRGAVSGDGSGTTRFGDFALDGAARELRRAGSEAGGRGGGLVALSPKEYDLLEYMTAQAGRALSREMIMNAVWGYDQVVTERSIDRFVTALRKKIETNPRSPEFIQTVRGFGYRFTGVEAEGG
jgi:two-component system alkaline phosphatase synthesis response regulator PhoP